MPIVQATGSPGDTVVVTGPIEGVFAERPTDAVGRLIQPTAPAAPPQAADEPFTIADQATTAMPSAISESGVAAISSTPPTALEPAEIDLRDANPISTDADDTAPELRNAADGPIDSTGLGIAGVAGAAGGLGLVGATVADDAPTNPFPEAGLVFDRQEADQLAAAHRDTYDPYANVSDGFNEGGTMNEASNPAPAKVSASANAAGMVDTGSSAKAAAVAGARSAADPGQPPLHAPPTDLAAGNLAGRQPRRAAGGAASAERLQDTEFKLADKRRKQKPQEPNRLVLALAMGLVVLVGIGVAWYLTSGGDPDAGEAAVEETPEAELAPEGASTESTGELTEPEPQVDEPTLFLDEAQLGPLQQSTAYAIDLVGEPTGSMLQVVVDDVPQGEPDPQLPDLILPPGRHTLHINMINGDVVAASTPVNVYVLGDPPPRGFRANLSSVDFQTEGWQEAIRQFDEFRAAGHEGLQLFPLSDGYWNIFVGGLGEDRAAAQAYCESFSLAVPDQCFPTYFEGAASADTTATTLGAEAETTTEDGESMTDAADGDTTSTSAAGG